MDISLLLTALLLGIIEGLTEFLPISSTGHLIVAGDLLGYNNEISKVFKIVIQLASILAVCWAYRARLAEWAGGILFRPRSLRAQRFALMLVIAFLPSAVLGFFFHSTIKGVLFNPLVVAGALIVGGLIILIVERRHDPPRCTNVDDIGASAALRIGFAQALAMIPGVSRSGATIVGGVIFGLSRTAATEFSFFLAIPTLFAATLYDVYKNWGLFKASDIPVFAVGCVAAFISAMWAVRFLLRFIASHTFVAFAWYRIAFGLAVLATWYFGVVNWSTPG
jgi:undecaprenyl-diphosphatase